MLNLTGVSYIDIALVFVVGLFLGLAVKKGIVAFALVVVAFIIAGFVGISFLPTVPPSKIISLVSKYFNIIISQVHLGGIALTLSFIVFIIGFVIGIWKG